MSSRKLPAMKAVAQAVVVSTIAPSGKDRTSTYETLPMPATHAQAGSLLSAALSREGAVSATAGEAQGAAMSLICEALRHPSLFPYAGKGQDSEGYRIPRGLWGAPYKGFLAQASERAEALLQISLEECGMPAGAIEASLKQARAGGTWAKMKSEALAYFWIVGSVPVDETGDHPRAFGSAMMRAVIKEIPQRDADKSPAELIQALIDKLFGEDDKPGMVFSADQAESAEGVAFSLYAKMSDCVKTLRATEAEARKAADGNLHASATMRKHVAETEGMIPAVSVTHEPAASVQ